MFACDPIVVPLPVITTLQCSIFPAIPKARFVDYPLTEANLCTFLPIGAKLLLLEEALGREVVLGAPGSTWAGHRARPVTLAKVMT